MKALFDKTKYTKWYITELGEVYSFTTYNKNIYRKKKTSINKKRGYVYARTSNGNYQVHRLVASAFIDNKYNKKFVNHKDGDKTNNVFSNLEWVTASENSQHAIKNGFQTQMVKNEGCIKYSNKVCKDVINRVKSGLDYKSAGRKYNMPYSTVAHLIRGSRRCI